MKKVARLLIAGVAAAAALAATPALADRGHGHHGGHHAKHAHAKHGPHHHHVRGHLVRHRHAPRVIVTPAPRVVYHRPAPV